MEISQYLEGLNKRFKTGISTEHTYRADLQNLLERLTKDILVTNEPGRIACGAPDYILTKKQIPVGYIEAKDIGTDLRSKGLKEQFSRYISALDNLIITDYIDFHFYLNQEFTTSIRIAEVENNQIKPIPENFEKFKDLIAAFCLFQGQTIRSSRKLAEMMAAKARLLAEVIERSLNSDEETRENSSIKDQMHAFKEILIHDIEAQEFADIYAQTIAYGMFSARLHDPSLETFSRQEAAMMIPKTNPFLRKLFQYIAGYDLDSRLVWIVDGLADIFRSTDIKALLKNFGRSTQTRDPIIHFYETFLSEYDPKLRKARGVWYTPEPVVSFIVRAVDDILKKEFGLSQGLADTSKTRIKVATQNFDKKTGKYIQEEREVHKVQILDPATGTGTFLAEVVKHIHKKFEGQQGIWSSYVESHLIPRLNGFELLMASYAMAHLKLDMFLSETGYKPTKDQRFRIYLTNSLEEHHADTGTLFANWLSDEANEANLIKRDTPVMVVIGNPPYSVSSSNKSEWIENLTADYKKDLNERNIQPLSDDYIKFIRFGQHFIDKNGEGVLAYISNNSFIDGLIHRQMRKHLLQSFDSIYILDLHGNSKKKEVAPDGTPDQNVFDIMQGVSINLFIKKKSKTENSIANVFHIDAFGRREEKYEFLDENSMSSIQWSKLELMEPNFFFVRKDFGGKEEYEEGFKVTDLFEFKTSGIKTHDDRNMVSFKSRELEQNILSLGHEFQGSKVNDYSYRPFDLRFVYYDTTLLGRAREKTIFHLREKNIGLVLVTQPQAANLDYFDCIFLTKCLTDTNIFRRGGPVTFPLYLYQRANHESFNHAPPRTPNLNPKIVDQIASQLSLTFTPEKEEPEKSNTGLAKDTESLGRDASTFAPIDLLDYIYAVLHSPNYREKYKEFLKIDFPRVPYPTDATTFWKLVELGGELRQIHLLESEHVEKLITSYPIEGSNTVDKPKYKNGKVFINATQYFDGVPEAAWQSYIGGYQPAQKWLKDRRGRQLSFEDILHYQKIILALAETERLMKEVDQIGVEW